MFVSFAVATVTLLRPQVREDGHGNTIPDWSLPPTSSTVPGCSVQPGASQELLVNRDTTLNAWTLFAPPTADIQATDRITWKGQDFEVEGEPMRWESPTGALNHTMALLKRWEG